MLITLLFLLPLFSLQNPATLSGQVTDQNGAVVVGAKVTARSSSGQVRTTTTGPGGVYSFGDLPQGQYTIDASAASLILQEPLKFTIKRGAQTLNLQLSVFIPEQNITVAESNRATVSMDSDSNASAQVLRGADLDALGDSPEDLQEALMALAGPSAGPSGGQIFVDGFSGSELPSKASITRNFGRGPGQLMLNLRLQKIFEFGRGENSGGASTGQPGSGPRTGTPGVIHTGRRDLGNIRSEGRASLQSERLNVDP